MSITAASILRENKKTIVDNWLKKLSEEMPHIKQHERPVIENSIPALLKALIEGLEKNQKDPVLFYSQQHGIQRTTFRDYSLAHIIREYNLLKATIFSTLDKYSHVEKDERDLIMFTIDQAIEQAGETYYRIKSNVLVDAHDLAEKKANELQIEDDNREEFIQSITHDLNNPLNTIKACIELIEDNVKVEDITKALDIIKSSINQAESIVEEFLNVKMIAGNETLPVNKVKVNIVKDLEKELEVYKISQKQEIVFKSSKDDILIDLDISLIRRAFSNLMNNALKHGDRYSKITVKCEIEGEQLIIQVHNDGHIPEDVLKNIFNRYYKIGSKSKGWGLGLSFVKKVANAHGGEIIVESSKKKGTTFSISIPK